MKRSEALSMLASVRSRVEPFGAIQTLGSSLTLDGTPVCFVNPSNAIVVHAQGSEKAATFPRPGSEAQIAALVLARFARRVAA